MTVTIKRNCSSSVRIADDKIIFGSISIILEKSDFERFKAIMKLYDPENPLFSLNNVIGIGILEEYEQSVIL